MLGKFLVVFEVLYAHGIECDSVLKNHFPASNYLCLFVLLFLFIFLTSFSYFLGPVLSPRYFRGMFNDSQSFFVLSALRRQNKGMYLSHNSIHVVILIHCILHVSVF
jgi:hypothetical protein